MSTISLHDATTRLPEIISGLNPGERLVIIKDGEPLATLTRSRLGQWPCKAGSAGSVGRIHLHFIELQSLPPHVMARVPHGAPACTSEAA